MKKFLYIIFFTGYSLFFAKTLFAEASRFTPPPSLPASLVEHINRNFTEFSAELTEVLEHEKENLLILVDKKHFLPDGYVPHDLIPLSVKRSYVLNRKDLSLTRTAENALEKMARAAREDGVTLVVSSTYRSYTYQKNLFDRYVRESGEKAAERFSARAGTSQHQLGTVIDFGSITDDFAKTRAGKWMAENAGLYGWSLSFPKGYEAVTGYVWESWHYRYIGVAACRLQKKWFGDVQQYMLEYIDAWKKQ